MSGHYDGWRMSRLPRRGRQSDGTWNMEHRASTCVSDELALILWQAILVTIYSGEELQMEIRSEALHHSCRNETYRALTCACIKAPQQELEAPKNIGLIVSTCNRPSRYDTT